jgi:hypothetical protein
MLMELNSWDSAQLREYVQLIMRLHASTIFSSWRSKLQLTTIQQANSMELWVWEEKEAGIPASITSSNYLLAM